MILYHHSLKLNETYRLKNSDKYSAFHTTEIVMIISDLKLHFNFSKGIHVK